MPRIRLDIEYCGENFHGWAVQKNARTVQGTLHKTLELVLKQPIASIVSSGRTDAGVHARQQVVSFQVPFEPDLERLARAVSGVLRGEVAVLSAQVVPDSFHARRSAKGKKYQYTILNRAVPPVLDLGRVWFIPRQLDVACMADAAQAFVGEHDFSSFRGSGCGARSPIKTIYAINVCREGDYIQLEFIGSGFLKHMIRILVGTLVDIAKGKIDLAPEEILQRKDRAAAGVTAPPYGLSLERVFYESPELFV